MKICIVFRQDVRKDGPVACYAQSCARILDERGHEVTAVGEGHEIETLDKLNERDFDLLFEVENGRNTQGQLEFQQTKFNWKIPSVLWGIDQHGSPSLHRRAAKHYNHVMFAVWAQRDLFVNHPSAHWAPCATDLKWFNYCNYSHIDPTYQFSFLGSKGGLDRANPLISVCEKNGWTYNVKQVTKSHKHKWPMFAEELAKAKNLYNRSQKHDNPNQRVMESMAMKRPLLVDSTDNKDGLKKAFVEDVHFIGYDGFTYSDLEEKCKWVLDNPLAAREIAANAYIEVFRNHTIDSRMSLLMEIIC